jgi:gamma-glutamylcyclotransferase (GGCT)/AIG2-like uncharacterized protein YtfP
VQLSTFGRRLDGAGDALPRYVRALVKIEDPETMARTGNTHHANVTFNGNENSRVDGTILDITDAELARADEFESAFDYKRIPVILASGREAWVYVHAPNT